MNRIVILLLLIAPIMVLAESDYAAWAEANPDGAWTAIAEKAVAASRLPTVVPSDIAKFCPNYPTLRTADRSKFWVGLLSAMARPESDFQPDKTYQESFKDRRGDWVISRGLLQLSQESANGYGCKIKNAKDLHDPSVNIPCSIRILDRWVDKDGVIASYKLDLDVRGGGRYWSVLRESANFLPEIAAFTQSLAFCKV
ncbi:MAG TPA: transglycosylase SLT domain-containing protein [Steroidobacter sp.]|uniref:transglycosylase SLT domain-containing protein n=1 Tax=Steroidobacter sp. TaxID=1978227 RepID=UPI002EDAE9CC